MLTMMTEIDVGDRSMVPAQVFVEG